MPFLLDFFKSKQMVICHSMVLISGTQVESDACYLHIKIKKANLLKQIFPIEKMISQNS